MELYRKWLEAEKVYCRTLTVEDRQVAVLLYARVQENRAQRRAAYKPWAEIKNQMKRMS